MSEPCRFTRRRGMRTTGRRSCDGTRYIGTPIQLPSRPFRFPLARRRYIVDFRDPDDIAPVKERRELERYATNLFSPTASNLLIDPEIELPNRRMCMMPVTLRPTLRRHGCDCNPSSSSRGVAVAVAPLRRIWTPRTSWR